MCVFSKNFEFFSILISEFQAHGYLFMNKLMRPAYRIRDPIYAYISLTGAELKISDAPIFQNLR